MELKSRFCFHFREKNGLKLPGSISRIELLIKSNLAKNKLNGTDFWFSVSLLKYKLVGNFQERQHL